MKLRSGRVVDFSHRTPVIEHEISLGWPENDTNSMAFTSPSVLCAPVNIFEDFCAESFRGLALCKSVEVNRSFHFDSKKAFNGLPIQDGSSTTLKLMKMKHRCIPQTFNWMLHRLDSVRSRRDDVTNILARMQLSLDVFGSEPYTKLQKNVALFLSARFVDHFHEQIEQIHLFLQDHFQHVKLSNAFRGLHFISLLTALSKPVVKDENSLIRFVQLELSFYLQCIYSNHVYEWPEDSYNLHKGIELFHNDFWNILVDYFVRNVSQFRLGESS